jgi:hypothetical protein
MEYTVNYTLSGGKCTATASIVLSSAMFDAFVAGQPTPDHSLKITISNHAGTEYEIDVDVADITEVGGDDDTYTILPANVSATTTIPDGVYSISLVKTVTDTGTTTTEHVCVFADCKVACMLIDVIALDLDSKLNGYYYLLNHLNHCADCNCEGAKVLYNEINSSFTTTTAEDDCGCN